MAFTLGAAAIVKLFAGAAPVAQLYLGSALVWPDLAVNLARADSTSWCSAAAVPMLAADAGSFSFAVSTPDGDAAATSTSFASAVLVVHVTGPAVVSYSVGSTASDDPASETVSLSLAGGVLVPLLDAAATSSSVGVSTPADPGSAAVSLSDAWATAVPAVSAAAVSYSVGSTLNGDSPDAAALSTSTAGATLLPLLAGDATSFSVGVSESGSDADTPAVSLSSTSATVVPALDADASSSSVGSSTPADPGSVAVSTSSTWATVVPSTIAAALSYGVGSTLSDDPDAAALSLSTAGGTVVVLSAADAISFSVGVSDAGSDAGSAATSTSTPGGALVAVLEAAAVSTSVATSAADDPASTAVSTSTSWAQLVAFSAGGAVSYSVGSTLATDPSAEVVSTSTAGAGLVALLAGEATSFSVGITDAGSDASSEAVSQSVVGGTVTARLGAAATSYSFGVSDAGTDAGSEATSVSTAWASVAALLSASATSYSFGISDAGTDAGSEAVSFSVVDASVEAEENWVDPLPPLKPDPETIGAVVSVAGVPTAVAVSDDGLTAYVCVNNISAWWAAGLLGAARTGELVVVDLRTNTITKRLTLPWARQVSVVGDKVYAFATANGLTGLVSVLDTASNNFVGTPIAVGIGNGTGLLAPPMQTDGRYLYVVTSVNEAARPVMRVIDTQTAAVTNTYPEPGLSTVPNNFAVDSTRRNDGQLFYTVGGTVLNFNPQTRVWSNQSQPNIFGTGVLSGLTGVGTGIWGMRGTLDGMGHPDGVIPFNFIDGSGGNERLFIRPQVIASATESTVFASLPYDNKVMVIDVVRKQVTAQIAVTKPVQVASHPRGDRVLIACSNGLVIAPLIESVEPPILNVTQTQVFSANGSVTIPAWADHIDVIAVGGGGGGKGGRSGALNSDGTGGGAGTWATRTLNKGADFAAGQTISVTVGQGGLGGAGSAFTVGDDGRPGTNSIARVGAIAVTAGGGRGSTSPNRWGNAPGNYTLKGITYIGGVTLPSSGAPGGEPGAGGTGGKGIFLTSVDDGTRGGNGRVWIRAYITAALRAEDRRQSLQSPNGLWSEQQPDGYARDPADEPDTADGVVREET